MSLQYKRKLGAQRYADYDPATLEAALLKLTNDEWSLRRASAEFKISFGTLRNKCYGLRIKKREDKPFSPKMKSFHQICLFVWSMGIRIEYSGYLEPSQKLFRYERPQYKKIQRHYAR